MKLAITCENGQIFQHFGHTAQYKLYEIADGKVVSAEVVDTNGSGHGALAGFLAQRGVDTLICGGVSGDAAAAVQALLSGSLQSDPDIQCSHHDGHSCHQ